MLKTVRAGIVSTAALSLVSTALASPTTNLRDLAADANRTLGLAASHVSTVTLQGLPSGQVVANVGVAGNEILLHLSPHSVRAPGFQLLEQGADGLITPVAPAPSTTYRGEVVGLDSSLVAASLLDEGLYARIHLEGVGDYWIEPLAHLIDQAMPVHHVIYRNDDVLPPDRICGVAANLGGTARTTTPRVATPSAGSIGAGGTPLFMGAKVAELACDADFEYYSDWGSSAAVQNRIESVINTVNVQYEGEVGITHEITTILVRTSSNQPYTSSDASTLLNQFRAQWNNNHGNIQRDVAQLFSGKSIIGGTIGIAWVGVVCNLGFAYSMVESDFNSSFSCSTDLSAHELGHNWNAGHCNCTSNTMNPFITCANTFNSNFTIPDITNYRDAVSCLGDGGTGGTPTSVHVASITATDVKLQKGRKVGQATVTIVNDLGQAVAGAQVSGSFSGDFNESGSATTNGNGVAVLTTNASKKGKVNFTFCVTNVSASLPYSPGDNGETCDSK